MFQLLALRPIDILFISALVTMRQKSMPRYHANWARGMYGSQRLLKIWAANAETYPPVNSDALLKFCASLSHVKYGNFIRRLHLIRKLKI